MTEEGEERDRGERVRVGVRDREEEEKRNHIITPLVAATYHSSSP